MIDVALNYVWFIFKLLALCIVLSIPILLLVYIFKGWFANSKKSFIFKLSTITYLISLIGISLMYFIPVLKIGLGDGYTFWNYVVFILLHLLWLIIINILITAILIIFGLAARGIYDSFNKSKDKKKKAEPINIKYLWLTLIITWIIIFIVYLIFPKLIAMLLYLIYLI